MALALNRFKTYTKTLTTSSATIYTAPTGYTGIILYAHVTNYGSATTTVTMSHVRSGTTNEIIKEANVAKIKGGIATFKLFSVLKYTIKKIRRGPKSLANLIKGLCIIKC